MLEYHYYYWAIVVCLLSFARSLYLYLEEIAIILLLLLKQILLSLPFLLFLTALYPWQTAVLSIFLISAFEDIYKFSVNNERSYIYGNKQVRSKIGNCSGKDLCQYRPSKSDSSMFWFSSSFNSPILNRTSVN